MGRKNPVVQFFTQPLATFADMLRMFGQKNADGRGYLFNRFVPQVNKASAQAWKGYEESMQELNAKIAEIYGKKGMTMSKLMRMAMKKGTATVYFMDGNEMKPHQLTVGNMLYIYMVNKMADGRMKLRKMGISETDVNNGSVTNCVGKLHFEVHSERGLEAREESRLGAN